MLSGIERLERIGAGHGNRFFDIVRHDRLDFEPGEVRYEFPVPRFERGTAAPTFASYCCAIADIACTSAVLSVLASSAAAVTQGLWVHFESVPADVRRVSATARAQRVAGARLLVDGRISCDTGETIARVTANCVGVTFAASNWSDWGTDSDPQPWAAEMKPLPLELSEPVAGSVQGVLTASDEFSNGVHMLHGGAATLMAEAVSRRLLDDGSRWTLADMDSRFIRPIPAGGGDAVACRASLRHSGRSSATVSWEILDGGRRVAVFGSTAWTRERA